MSADRDPAALAAVPAAALPAAAPRAAVASASALPAAVPSVAVSPAAVPLAAERPRRFGRRAALLGAAAGVLSLRAAPASAEINEGQLLMGLWRREMGLALAYDRQAHVEPERFVLARLHANTHAAAIATQLAAVGLGTPKPPQTPSDLDAAAQQLATARRADVLASAALVEEAMVAAYKAALLELSDAKIAMTVATILASHAQHLFIFDGAAQVS